MRRTKRSAPRHDLPYLMDARSDIVEFLSIGSRKLIHEEKVKLEVCDYALPKILALMAVVHVLDRLLQADGDE